MAIRKNNNVSSEERTDLTRTGGISSTENDPNRLNDEDNLDTRDIASNVEEGDEDYDDEQLEDDLDLDEDELEDDDDDEDKAIE